MKMKKIYRILLLIAVCIHSSDQDVKKRIRLAAPGFTIQTQREFHWLRRAQESKGKTREATD